MVRRLRSDRLRPRPRLARLARGAPYRRRPGHASLCDGTCTGRCATTPGFSGSPTSSSPKPRPRPGVRAWRSDSTSTWRRACDPAEPIPGRPRPASPNAYRSAHRPTPSAPTARPGTWHRSIPRVCAPRATNRSCGCCAPPWLMPVSSGSIMHWVSNAASGFRKAAPPAVTCATRSNPCSPWSASKRREPAASSSAKTWAPSPGACAGGSPKPDSWVARSCSSRPTSAGSGRPGTIAPPASPRPEPTTPRP